MARACAPCIFTKSGHGQRGGSAGATMNMVLRPGRRWPGVGSQCEPVKQPRSAADDAYLSVAHLQWSVGIPPGLLERNLAQWSLQRGEHHLRPRRLAAEEGKTARSSGRCRSPYVFVGGRLERKSAAAKFSVSVDGKTWERVKDNLDKFFSTVGPARYEYKLKCQLEGPVRLRRLAIINDVQMAAPCHAGDGRGREHLRLF